MPAGVLQALAASSSYVFGSNTCCLLVLGSQSLVLWLSSRPKTLAVNVLLCEGAMRDLLKAILGLNQLVSF